MLLSPLTWCAFSMSVLCFPSLSLLLSSQRALGVVPWVLLTRESSWHGRGAAIGMCHSGSRAFALDMCWKRRILFQLVGPEFCETTIVLHRWWLACNKPKILNATGKGIPILGFHFWLAAKWTFSMVAFWVVFLLSLC